MANEVQEWMTKAADEIIRLMEARPGNLLGKREYEFALRQSASIIAARLPWQRFSERYGTCNQHSGPHTEGYFSPQACLDWKPLNSSAASIPVEAEPGTPISHLLDVIRTWIVTELGLQMAAFSHPELKVKVTIRGYKKIILERTFDDEKRSKSVAPTLDTEEER
jgi:hypothetical protein